MIARKAIWRVPIIALGLLLALITGARAADSVEDLKAAVEAIRQKHQVPGLAMIVVKDGRVVAQGVSGVRKIGTKASLTMQDQFHIGSCTKSMTATLAAKLVEAGAIRWDSTIEEVFPEWKKEISPEYRKVTLTQLLSHHSGAPGKADPGVWSSSANLKGAVIDQRRAFVKGTLARPPEAPPGSRMIYSNQGVIIAGAMLEKATRRTWEDLVREKVFNPLGMLSAGFGQPGARGGFDQPWGHINKEGVVTAVQGDNPPFLGPAGTVHLTLADMAKYLIFHLKGDRGEGLYLKPATFQKLHTEVGGGAALGWFVAERPWAGGNGKTLNHTGSNTMNYMTLWLAPGKDFAVAAVCNAGIDRAGKACDELVNLAVQKYAK